jgi:hypothetical protein
MRETMVFTGREVNSLSTGIGGGLRRAFDGLVFDGMKLSDALKGVAKTISTRLFGIAMKPVAMPRAGPAGAGHPAVMGAFHALCQGRRLHAGPGDALCQGRGGLAPGQLSDAGRDAG